MGFLAWIGKIQHALHECAESIRNSERRKKEQSLPPDKPVEVRAVVSYDELTVRNARADRDRSHGTEVSMKTAAWAAVAAASIYAVITLGVLCQMIRQNTIAGAALKISQKAWVGIDSKPTIEVE